MPRKTSTAITFSLDKFQIRRDGQDGPYAILGSVFGYTWIIKESKQTNLGHIGEDARFAHELFLRFVRDLAIELEGRDKKSLRDAALRAWCWESQWPSGLVARCDWMKTIQYLDLLEHVVAGHTPRTHRGVTTWTKRVDA